MSRQSEESFLTVVPSQHFGGIADSDFKMKQAANNHDGEKQQHSCLSLFWPPLTFWKNWQARHQNIEWEKCDRPNLHSDVISKTKTKQSKHTQKSASLERRMGVLCKRPKMWHFQKSHELIGFTISVWRGQASESRAAGNWLKGVDGLSLPLSLLPSPSLSPSLSLTSGSYFLHLMWR